MNLLSCVRKVNETEAESNRDEKLSSAAETLADARLK